MIRLGWRLKRTIEAGKALAHLLEGAKGAGFSAAGTPTPSTPGDLPEPTAKWSGRSSPDISGETKPPEAKYGRPVPTWIQPVSGGRGSPSGDSHIPWMYMSIETPTLKLPKFAKGIGNTDNGSIFRSPHRLLSDQRVFRQNRARRTGSVLIDTSGSMSLSPSDIEEMVKKIPAAVIAIYGGRDRKNGALRILARQGKLVCKLKQYNAIGDYNGVDGPALRWLLYQPQPRIWISDGMVTGVRDCTHPRLNLEAADTCERGRIMRVHTINKALRLL